MLIGQKIGPFAVEKELGSGAMGTVYRAKYKETGQYVAIKVMAPGLGTNERSVARFEREGAILKQLRHPNIVRLFGVGRFHGAPYYAMEYLEGESLDYVMERRGKLPWEEVVRIGQQLCAALFHAHQQGIVHRDLKPSNLMMLKDGTVKLTDFGIAKDLDVTQLTSANCTVGTAAYMSPEQCRGEKDLTHKSDLYSMGVMFYELLVGRKPFTAENAMDMFLQHVQGAFERPGRLELDTPIWLDNLVCQLLEKKPEQRPRDAATVGDALSSIAEKVQAQQSAGVDAAKKRFADRVAGSARPQQEDKESARLLLNGKFRVKRRRKVIPLFERTWMKALGIGSLLVAIAAVIFLALRPPSEDKLYRAIKDVMNQSTGDRETDLAKFQELKEGRGALTQYLQYYGKDNTPHRQEVEAWDNQIIALEQEDQLRKKMTRKFGDKEIKSGEELAWKALRYEDLGDAPSALKAWEKLLIRIKEESVEGRVFTLAKVKQSQLKKIIDETPEIYARRLELVTKKVKEVEKLKKDGETKRARELSAELRDLYKDHENEALKDLIKTLDPEEKKD